MSTQEVTESGSGKRGGCINFYIVAAVLGAFSLTLIGLSGLLGDVIFLSSASVGTSILAIIIGAVLATVATGLFMMRAWARWLALGLHGVLLVLTIVLPLVASRENSELQDLVTVSDNARIVSNIAVGLVVNLVVIYWLAISTEDFT
jgi:hypothetical protein